MPIFTAILSAAEARDIDIQSEADAIAAEADSNPAVSLNDAVRRVLADASAPMGALDIADAVLAHYPRPDDWLVKQNGRSRHTHSVAGALSHLKESGEVAHSDGLYRLAEADLSPAGNGGRAPRLPALAANLRDTLLGFIREAAPRAIHIDELDIRARAVCQPDGPWLLTTATSRADRFRTRVFYELSRLTKAGRIERIRKGGYRAHAGDRESAQTQALREVLGTLDLAIEAAQQVRNDLADLIPADAA